MNRSITEFSPRTGDTLRSDSSVLNVADMLSDLTTLFGKVSTVERTPIIELKPSFGLSALRDIQTTVGSATITESTGEFKLATTASGTDSAVLDSAQRGQYIPGSVAETGIAVRLPQDMTGSQIARWGYFDDDDGFFFGQDSTGVFVRTRRGGTDQTKVYQSDWNADTVDGTGGTSNPSGIDLGVADGHVFQTEFAWYGYGVIEFVIFIEDDNTRQQRVVVHRRKVKGSLSVDNPNLPIRAELDNGGDATASDLFVGGRQFALLGRSRPNERINGEFRTLGSIGTTFLPVMSFRKKSAFTDVTVKLRQLAAFADANLRYQVRLNATLTGGTNPSWGGLTDTTASETALEVDTTATAISGGEILDKGLLSSSGGNKAAYTQTGLLAQAVPEQQPVTLAVRTLSGTGATVDATMTLQEEW